MQIVYYTIVYHHRHGVDCYVMFQKNEPTTQEIIDKNEIFDFNDDGNEYFDIFGPDAVPQHAFKK